MASRRGVPLGILVTALALSAVGTAYAQPTLSPSERETARSLMSDGRAARDHGDLKGALVSFKAADAIMHVPTTSLEVARTQAALGQLVEARDTLSELLRSAVRPGEPRPFAEARTNALALDDDLAARIPSLRLVLEGSPPADPHVAVNGVAIPAVAATAPMKVDPGHHVITAGEHVRGEIDIAERQTRSLTLSFAGETPAAVSDEASPAPADGGHHTMRTLALAGFGVGAIGIVTGSVAGILSIEKTSSVKSTCAGDVCPPSSSRDLDSARSTAMISTIAFIAGGVGVGVGVVGLLIGDKSDGVGDKDKADKSARAEKPQARIVPWIGIGSAGVKGTF